jgi:hypothetical protein
MSYQDINNRLRNTLIKQTKHTDGQIFWFTYEPALPIKLSKVRSNHG